MALCSMGTRYSIDMYMNNDDDLNEENEESLLVHIEEECLANKNKKTCHCGSVMVMILLIVL